MYLSVKRNKNQDSSRNNLNSELLINFTRVAT